MPLVEQDQAVVAEQHDVARLDPLRGLRRDGQRVIQIGVLLVSVQLGHIELDRQARGELPRRIRVRRRHDLLRRHEHLQHRDVRRERRVLHERDQLWFIDGRGAHGGALRDGPCRMRRSAVATRKTGLSVAKTDRGGGGAADDTGLSHQPPQGPSRPFPLSVLPAGIPAARGGGPGKFAPVPMFPGIPAARGGELL